MNKSIKQVQEFHELFDQRIGDIKYPEPLDVRQLRIKLLFEELEELSVASDCMGTFADLCNRVVDTDLHAAKDGDNVDKVEELDALCDIQYVLNGKILTGGYHKIFDKSFDIVHENNMKKAHRDLNHAKATAMIKSIHGGNVKQKGDHFLLYNESGKLIKPHDHKKVKLTLY